MVSPDTTLSLPEWYGLERETERTINKLAAVKELDYYLHNHDEYIRRLAVIRLSALKPKGCENSLREILEEHFESNENKELAAWTIKAISLKWNSEIFIDNRYLARFSGNEKFSDLFNVIYEEHQPSLRFNFARNPAYGQILLDREVERCDQNIRFETGFDFKQWISALSSNIISAIVSTLKNAVTKIRQRPKRNARPGRRSNYGERWGTYNAPDIMPLIVSSRSSALPRFSIFTSAVSLIKKVVFNVLYVLFFPVRFFLRHKLAVLYIIAALYIFFNFTVYGKVVFNKYLGKDFIQMQDKTVGAIKRFSISVWDEFKDLTGFDGVFKNAQADHNSDPEIKVREVSRYSVTAARGLNIRKAPGASSEKVNGGSLVFGSIVTYMDKAIADSSGNVWYYIQADDGRAGWVSAKYLAKKEVE